MNCWTMQNTTILKQWKIEKITKKVYVVKDIKKNYAKVIQDLSFS